LKKKKTALRGRETVTFWDKGGLNLLAGVVDRMGGKKSHIQNQRGKKKKKSKIKPTGKKTHSQGMEINKSEKKNYSPCR